MLCKGCRHAEGIFSVGAGGTTTVAYRDDELLEMKPRNKGAPCKRFVIELDATTPSSVSSSDFLIAASHPGSRILQFTPSSTTSRGVHSAVTCCFLAAPLTHQPQEATSLHFFPDSLPHSLCRFENESLSHIECVCMSCNKRAAYTCTLSVSACPCAEFRVSRSSWSGSKRVLLFCDGSSPAAMCSHTLASTDTGPSPALPSIRRAAQPQLRLRVSWRTQHHATDAVSQACMPTCGLPCVEGCLWAMCSIGLPARHACAGAAAWAEV